MSARVIVAMANNLDPIVAVPWPTWARILEKVR